MEGMSAKGDIRRWTGESDGEKRYFRVAFLGDADSQRSGLVNLILDGVSGETGRGPHGITVSIGEIAAAPKMPCLVKFIDFGNNLIEANLYPHFMPQNTLYVVVCAHLGLYQRSVLWLEEIRRYAGACPVILAPNLTEGDFWKERERIEAQIREKVKPWEGGRKTSRPHLCAVTPFRFRNAQTPRSGLCDLIVRRQNGVSELADAIVRQIAEKLADRQTFINYSDKNKEDYCDYEGIVRQSELVLRLYQGGKKEGFPSIDPVAKVSDIGKALFGENIPDEKEMARTLDFFQKRLIAFRMDERRDAFLFPALFKNQPDFEQYRGNLRLRWQLTSYPDVCAPMPEQALYGLACQKNSALDLERSGKNVIAFSFEEGCQIQVKLDGAALDIIVRDNADWESSPNHQSARRRLHEFRNVVGDKLQDCKLETTESVVFHSSEGDIVYTRTKLETCEKKKFHVPDGSCMGRAGKYSGKAILNAHSYDPKKDSIRVIVRNLIQTFGVFLILGVVVTFLSAQIPEQLSAPSAFAYLIVFLIILAVIFFWKPKWRKHVERWIEKNPGLLAAILKALLPSPLAKDNPPDDEKDHPPDEDK